jgi:pimeloyl-ACP methyl ester carboxylesterase
MTSTGNQVHTRTSAGAYGMSGSAVSATVREAQIERINIGGRSLAMVSRGSGSPTVVLESGLGAESAWYEPVQDAVAQFTSVVRFDRASKGLSDPAPTPRTSHDMAADLYALLANADVPGPYVLVGQSVGGLNVRVYAARYPKDVVGMVLVDSMHEDQFLTLGPMLPPPYPGEPAALTGVRQFWTKDWTDPTKNVEGIDFPVSCEQGRAVTSLGDLPLVVLTADWEQAPELREAPAEFRSLWAERWWALQSSLAALSSQSTHLLVPGSGHFIQRDAPEAVVAAIRQVLDMARR